MTDKAPAAPVRPEDDPTMLVELRRDEGCEESAYTDSRGFLTIGVGRLIDARLGGGLSQDEIDYLLRNDVKSKAADLDKHLPWWRTLDPVRQRVLLNMCFNMGIGGLLGFKNTLAAVTAHDWERAAVGMLASKWATQVKGRATRLAAMMRSGKA